MKTFTITIGDIRALGPFPTGEIILDSETKLIVTTGDHFHLDKIVFAQAAPKSHE